MPHDALRGSRRALLAGLALDNFGSGLFLPLTLVFLHQVGGLAVDRAGFAVTLGTLLGLAAPPLAGRAVDSVGPRRVLIGSLLLQAAGVLGYLLAHDWPVTAVSAALAAAGTQTFYSSLLALIADVHGSGPQDHAFARVGQVRSAAFGAGALLAAGLLSLGAAGLRAAAVMDIATFVMAAGWLLVGVHPRPHQRPAANRESDSDGGPARRRTVTADRAYLALVAVSGCAALSADVFLVGLPVYALTELATPSWVPGICTALLTAITALCGTAAVRATASYRRSSVIAAGAALSVAWALLAMLALLVSRPAAVVLLLAGTVVEAAASLLHGRMNALAEATAPLASRGRYLAAFQLAFTSAALIAPAVVGLSAHGAALPWLIVALTSTTAALIYPALGRSLRSREAAPSLH